MPVVGAFPHRASSGLRPNLDQNSTLTWGSGGRSEIPWGWGGTPRACRYAAYCTFRTTLRQLGGPLMVSKVSFPSLTVSTILRSMAIMQSHTFWSIIRSV